VFVCFSCGGGGPSTGRIGSGERKHHKHFTACLNASTVVKQYPRLQTVGEKIVGMKVNGKGEKTVLSSKKLNISFK